MKYLIWLVGGVAALDQGMKSEIEQETDGEFPRDLPGAKGRIRIHRNHNYGFPFGFLKEKPQLVTAVPLAVSSAVARRAFHAFGEKGLRDSEGGAFYGFGRRVKQPV